MGMVAAMMTATSIFSLGDIFSVRTTHTYRLHAEGVTQIAAADGHGFEMGERGAVLLGDDPGRARRHGGGIGGFQIYRTASQFQEERMRLAVRARLPSAVLEVEVAGTVGVSLDKGGRVLLR